ncbi:MAG: hypothetical protein WAM04_15160, partial [Candidatus Sulfotelmatobacter sp.]
MAQPTDESKAAILPDPELNPLLNPLLAAHMGRWAEVYFTSPPEKRAQAVSDLVRELANNSTTEPGSSQRPNDERIWKGVKEEGNQIPRPKAANIFEQHASVSEAAIFEPISSESTICEPMVCEPMIQESAIQEPIVCESCGHKNAPRQRFCGMCGTPLAIAWQNPSQRFAETEPTATETWDQSRSISSGHPESELEPPAESAVGSDYHEAEQSEVRQNLTWPPPENSRAEFSMLSEYQSEPASHSYRIYVGAVVVILLGLLVYMTWRSNTAFWSSGTAPSALPQAVPAAKSEPAAATEPPAAPPPQPVPKADATAEPARTAATPQSPESTEARPDDARRADRRPAARTVSVSVNPAGSAAEQNGSEELAAAEKYLNAGPGTARDSREAATWLWKAVAKQNSAATLLLSDLYLRGDGVTKSCDQARLLLDAAARKGATAAAERLRNLQA